MIPVDYRNSAVRHLQTITSALRSREAIGQLLFIAKAMIGLAAMFLGPLVLTGLLAYSVARFAVPIEFWHWFWVTAAIIIPLLFVLEIRSRGRFLDDEAAALAMDHAPLYKDGPVVHSRSEWVYRGDRAAWIFYLELFLLGPRLLLGAWHQQREILRLRRVNHAVAARIVSHLLENEDGILTGALMRGGEAPEEFNRALAYLELHDWIGVGRRKDRVWLLSDARRRLV